MTFREFLRRRIWELSGGESLNSLSTRAGWAKNTLSQMLKRKGSTFDRIDKMASALGITYEELLGLSKTASRGRLPDQRTPPPGDARVMEKPVDSGFVQIIAGYAKRIEEDVRDRAAQDYFEQKVIEAFHEARSRTFPQSDEEPDRATGKQ